MKHAKSDVELIEACLGGNSAAFEGLVRKYQSLVCAITFGVYLDALRRDTVGVFYEPHDVLSQPQNQRRCAHCIGVRQYEG